MENITTKFKMSILGLWDGHAYGQTDGRTYVRQNSVTLSDREDRHIDLRLVGLIKLKLKGKGSSSLDIAPLTILNSGNL